MKSKSGGGITSRNKREVGFRTGKGGKATNPGYVAQLGTHVGDHTTGHKSSTGYRGEIFHKGPAYNPSKFGNELAAATKCGPGGSREVMKTGSQGTHGSVKPGKSPARRDILSEFGPESSRGR
jgi:hypothetical protein